MMPKRFLIWKLRICYLSVPLHNQVLLQVGKSSYVAKSSDCTGSVNDKILSYGVSHRIFSVFFYLDNFNLTIAKYIWSTDIFLLDLYILKQLTGPVQMLYKCNYNH